MGLHLIKSAEKEGFEPPDLLQSTVFKTAAIDHSAISPGAKVIINFILQLLIIKNISAKEKPGHSAMQKLVVKETTPFLIFSAFSLYTSR